MYLDKLNLINFKNYAQEELVFSPRLNCFVGNNGSGKTNVLDSIHYLCLCKSYFNAIDSQNIRHDEDFMVIQGNFQVKDEPEEIYCGIKRNKRKIFRRNKKEYQKLSEHIGLIPLVMISPADSGLILDGSEERRKFINSVISQFDKSYLNTTIQYNHLILQRNKLLKEFGRKHSYGEDTLEIYDEQIVPLGNKIYEKRVEFAERLVPIFQKYYNFISGGNEKVELIYQSQLEGNDFLELLRKNREKDKILQYTTIGIHKDDLILNLDGYHIKKVGSQGQQKTFLVALKLAQFDFIKEVNKINPILLLDDIFDKFDVDRVKQIIRLVSDHNYGQIFITHTNLDRMEAVLADIDIDYRLFLVENGKINQN